MTSLEIIKDELAKIEKDEDHILAGRQGNMIKYLSKALSVAVTELDKMGRWPQSNTDVHSLNAGIILKSIANILSGGKDGK